MPHANHASASHHFCQEERTRARTLALAVLLSACVTLTACSWWSSDVVIPVLPTAQEQFDLATREFRNYTGFWGAGSQRNEYAERALAAYQTVIDKFPQEQSLVARSELCIGIIWKQQGKEHKALGILKGVQEKYASDDDVQIKTLHEIGLLLDDCGKHRQAKDYYDRVMKRYTQSTKQEHKAIVADCKSRYQRVWSGGK
jgi:hypothetical protein